MTQDKKSIRGELSLERLKTFSDGVFAIAITLLVLAIHLPTPQELNGKSLLAGLLEQWPSYLGFVLSFLLIGGVWASQHTMFSLIKRANLTLIFINTLLLLDVAFLPFPTELLTLYAGHGADQQLAVLLYSGGLAVGGIFFNLIWWYALHANLVEPGEDTAELKRLGRRFLMGPTMYFVAFLLGFLFDGVLSIALLIVLAIVYWFPTVAETRANRPATSE